MNDYTVSGHISKEIKFRITQATSKEVATFPIAVYRKAFFKGQKDVIFLPIVARGDLANRCNKYYKKGNKVLIKGWVNIRDYTDCDGIKRWVAEVMATHIESMDRIPNADFRQGQGKDLADYPEPQEYSHMEIEDEPQPGYDNAINQQL